MPARYEARFSARGVALRLGAAMGVLLTLHIAAACLYWTDARQSLGLEFWQISIFDLDEEDSFGTWFSTMLLMAASVLLFLHARRCRDEGDTMHRAWWVLGLGFAGLSIDEVAGIHELIATLYDDTPWTHFGAAIAGVVGLAFLPFLWKLPARTRALFLLAGFVYLGGALGVERATDVFDTATARRTLEYNLWNTLEEGMEMGGALLFLYALVSHMAGGPTALLWQTTELRESTGSTPESA